MKITKQQAKEAFENAISQGLNTDNYMFMCSSDGIDYFKHSITRQTITFKRNKEG